LVYATRSNNHTYPGVDVELPDAAQEEAVAEEKEGACVLETEGGSIDADEEKDLGSFSVGSYDMRCRV